MEHKNPIYSEETRCRDCYRCIRECPVKAIRVVDGEAEVIADSCILCGHCVAVCPVGAKKVRDDLRRVVHLINRKKTVILSLAPSFSGEFEEIPPENLIAAIRKLGFYGVSETALGAQVVSTETRQIISQNKTNLHLSTACPSAVELIVKYFPEFVQNLTQIYSPLLAHCILLRKLYGEDIGIVFCGPCIAKKKEADVNPSLLDLVITFEDLRRWLESSKIDLSRISTTPEDQFIPCRSHQGALYPIEGGMIATLEDATLKDVRFMTLSGVDTIQQALAKLNSKDLSRGLFIELLACENGCIKGPGTTMTTPVGSRMAILNYTENRAIESNNNDNIFCNYEKQLIDTTLPTPTPEQLQKALEKIGKFTEEEELNCDSCGYGTCRDLATALLENKAEPCMCSSYMRQLAQKKANALIKTLPYGVVIVDSNLKIIDSNDRFANLFGEEIEEISKVVPGLKNADLPSILPCSDLFLKVLSTGEDITQQFIKHKNMVYAITIFTVEKSGVVGAILRDATLSEFKREQIVEKAQEVIRNTSVTAQQIAFLMGKNAAQSEKILNSLIESFSYNDNSTDKQV